MNIAKAVGVVTAGIPIVGILVGGIAFGLNFKTDVQNIKEDVSNQQTINADIEERFNELAIPAPYDDSLLWLQADTTNERIDGIHIPDRYDDSFPINISNEEEISIKELVSVIAELMSFNGKIEWDTSKPNGQPRRCVSNKKAEEKFGFIPEVTLKDGLNQTIEWFNSQQ